MIRLISILNEEGSQTEQILELAKEGVTKKDIMLKLSLSRPRVRRLTAELVNKDLLRYHATLNSFMTTARGHSYLKRESKSKPSATRLKARDICREIIMLNSSKTLWDARNEMIRYNISRIVVSDNSKPLSIVTEKDIARFLYKNPPSRGLNEIALKELGDRKPITVGGDSTIADCAQIMLKNQISSVLVTNSDRKTIGIITKTDITEVYAYHMLSRIRVREHMSKKVYTVAPDEMLYTVAMLMTAHNISRVIVVSKKKPIGIITSRDFLPISLVYGIGTFGRYWTKTSQLIGEKNRQMFIPSGVLAMTLAEDIMTRSPLWINMNVGLSDAAKMMIRNRISGLPVVDGHGNLVGIITKTDVVKAKIPV
ncbi:MAG TPA: CBS domain-containing protein [Nitrososphaeraceae archaeon]